MDEKEEKGKILVFHPSYLAQLLSLLAGSFTTQPRQELTLSPDKEEEKDRF